MIFSYIYVFIKTIIIDMVESEEIFIKNMGKTSVHYCSICKIAFLKFVAAERCELSHKDKNEHYSRARNEKSNWDSSILNVIKYNVLVREAYGGKTHEFYLKAPNIREAADMVKGRYPHHSGYTIKKARA
jgi:hypothetical protein